MASKKIVIAFDMDQDHLEQIRGAYPTFDFTVQTEQDQISGALVDAGAVIGWGRYDAATLAGAPELRWVHTFGAGVDTLLSPELIDSEIVVTNNSGVRGPNIAEHILAMMLGFARGLPEIMRYQTRREWHDAERGVFELGGQTLGVVGLGDIGQALAWRANALGMKVIGVRRNQFDLPRGVEHVHPLDELHTFLGEADHVAICLPLTPTTRKMFGAAEFAAMKPSAYIYNIGRGAIIDQDALVTALQSKQIAGAGLDVTDPEPLPADSPLWDMTNVQITCHTSGATPYNWERGMEILIDNLGRFDRGEPLRNVVDKDAGY
ncbi:MAG: D-2-hydroxyacid dehydrogenase [Chloroflexia bacterium]|nr:D-2-hydroxyacid dehydrogenase [Chloroflexia bacterium]